MPPLNRLALSIRLEGMKQDEAARRKELEESLKKSLAQGATVNLVSAEGWESSEGPVKASFEVEVPNFDASRATGGPARRCSSRQPKQSVFSCTKSPSNLFRLSAGNL
jgi:hypothetical protein